MTRPLPLVLPLAPLSFAPLSFVLLSLALPACARPRPPAAPAAALPAAPADNGPTARARYFVLAAAWRESQGDLPGAIQAIRSALLHDPGDPWLLARLAALEARPAAPAPDPAPDPVLESP